MRTTLGCAWPSGQASQTKRRGIIVAWSSPGSRSWSVPAGRPSSSQMRTSSSRRGASYAQEQRASGAPKRAKLPLAPAPGETWL